MCPTASVTFVPTIFVALLSVSRPVLVVFLMWVLHINVKYKISQWYIFLASPPGFHQRFKVFSQKYTLNMLTFLSITLSHTRSCSPSFSGGKLPRFDRVNLVLCRCIPFSHQARHSCIHSCCYFPLVIHAMFACMPKYLQLNIKFYAQLYRHG